MTPETDKEALIAVSKGAIVFALITVFIVGFILLASDKNPQPQAKFMVVDEYNGCQVVRYYPKNDAVAAYFLDCRDFNIPEQFKH